MGRCPGSLVDLNELITVFAAPIFGDSILHLLADNSK